MLTNINEINGTEGTSGCLFLFSKGADCMEHNKNGMLALIVLFVGLAFFVFGMVYHLWGTV